MIYKVKRKNARTICQERGINYGTWVYRVYGMRMDKEEAMEKPVRTAEVVKERKERVGFLNRCGLKTVDIAQTVGLSTVRVSQILRGK